MVFLYVFLGAIALVAIVVFAIQNAAPVTVSFYNWRFDASLAIVVFLSFLAGMVIEGLFVASLRLKRGIKRRRRKTTDAPEEEKTQPPRSDLPL